ncbi:MAG TPA: tRNA lysidine(34) synthetase TilS [Candidatus Dormibacteraeota bacterium]|nr:tRNA lysidine(34) synthetase TilS [Candidatus Dormibacteraeota bacterium]
MDIKEQVSQKLKPGKYIIAVSGGVDSVALLNIASKINGIELIVAHFDHGIRSDSKLDQLFVRDLAIKYQLTFETKSVQLGSNASEKLARDERYRFLKLAMDSHQAVGIITAHHQDDIIETAVFNLLRGTGRRGVTSLSSNELMIRPLLDVTKDHIKQYALQNKLSWREDSTNQDLKYSRNLIRSKLASKDKLVINKLLSEIDNLKSTNQELDSALDELLINVTEGKKLSKTKFISLTHGLALEIMVKWLRLNGITEYDSKLLNNLVIAAKTYKNRSKFSINKTAYLLIETEFLVIKTTTS